MKIMQQCYKDRKRFEHILYNRTGSVYKKKFLHEHCFKRIMNAVVVMPLH
jgi:hypothetical protein